MQTTKSEAASSPRHDHVLSEATARPWSANKNNHYWEIHGPSVNDRIDELANTSPSNWQTVDGVQIKTPERAAANAALIVKAVNRDHHFDELVKALEYARVGIAELCHEQNPANECWNILREIDAALAGAK